MQSSTGKNYYQQFKKENKLCEAFSGKKYRWFDGKKYNEENHYEWYGKKLAI